MGLDWNPGHKPKPGHEAEFERLFHELGKKKIWWRERKQKRFNEISITAFETLNAPRVGTSPDADDWALEIYRREPRDESVLAWLDKLRGFYVLDLVEACDGIPRYSNGTPGGYVERYSFRAEFLSDCEYVIGPDLLEASYVSKLPPEFLTYGEALKQKAAEFVTSRGVGPFHPESDDPDGPASHADIVGAAARWCLFWASRGHFLDAYW